MTMETLMLAEHSPPLKPTHYVVDIHDCYNTIKSYCNDLIHDRPDHTPLSVKAFFMLVYCTLGYHGHFATSVHLNRAYGYDHDVAKQLLAFSEHYIDNYIRGIYDEDDIWMSDVRFYHNTAADSIFSLIFTYPAEYSRERDIGFPNFLFERLEYDD